MPEPGDIIEAFSPQPGRCFRMVYSVQLQADDCRGEPAWKGICTESKGAKVVRRGVRRALPDVEQRRVGGLLRRAPTN